jgi:hypothetical protein
MYVGFQEATDSQGWCLLHLLPRDRGVGDICPCGLCGHLDGKSGCRVAENRCVSVVSVVIREADILV